MVYIFVVHVLYFLVLSTVSGSFSVSVRSHFFVLVQVWPWLRHLGDAPEAYGFHRMAAPRRPTSPRGLVACLLRGPKVERELRRSTRPFPNRLFERCGLTVARDSDLAASQRLTGVRSGVCKLEGSRICECAPRCMSCRSSKILTARSRSSFATLGTSVRSQAGTRST